MSDLRKAAEMALAKLDHLWEIAVDERMNTDVLPEIQALRQALAKPEWVGLDKSDMNILCSVFKFTSDANGFIRLVEEKLKEKNS